MIATLFNFAVSHMELGFVSLGIGLAIWGSAHKRQRRALR